ncbi:MAG: hypothetical protein KME07_14415 [Pegethrix bostrychoides GSE-TBD4-15B]|jgi:hypothetical protein|uniref:Uncharacterized protein n=1 Tax=Pegethrix bostrychoides GSE-TBD4-15B TaxID=2839662 RepID=A0A951PCB5_9CYAN|nr:hypothetical protein [Pegethrix bostrychoides GSE-TBD4-15B]
MADDFSELPSHEPAQRERLKYVLYGSKCAIARTIHQLHNRGYAETSDWSRPNPSKTLANS